MDVDRLLRDLRTSVVLPVGPEARLLAGGLLAVGVYLVWLVLSALVVFAVAASAGYSLGGPWAAGETGLALVVLVLWVLGPAWVGTRLLVGELTNDGGNLRSHYRVEFPAMLVVPPLVLFGVLFFAGVTLGDFPAPLIGALVAAGLFVLVRTVAFSYRVFSLSAPRTLRAFVSESACLLAVTILAAFAGLVGRGEAVTAAARAIDGALGTAAVVSLVTGTRDIAGAPAPTLPALAAVFPVVLSLAYVLGQTVVGLTARARDVTVARSAVRVDQRYPAFARPDSVTSPRRVTAVNPGTDGTSPEASASENSGPAATSRSDSSGAQSGAEDSTGGSDAPGDGTTNETNDTRVFTPPEDADLDESLPQAVAPETTDEEDVDSAVASGGDDGWESIHANAGGEASDAGNNGEEAPDEGTVERVQSGNDAPPAPGDGDGHAADTGEAESDADGYTCPNCGEQFSGATDFAFCPVCGTALG